MPQATQFLLVQLVRWHSEFIVKCTQRSRVYVGYYHYQHSYLKFSHAPYRLPWLLHL